MNSDSPLERLPAHLLRDRIVPLLDAADFARLAAVSGPVRAGVLGGSPSAAIRVASDAAPPRVAGLLEAIERGDVGVGGLREVRVPASAGGVEVLRRLARAGAAPGSLHVAEPAAGAPGVAHARAAVDALAGGLGRAVRALRFDPFLYPGGLRALSDATPEAARVELGGLLVRTEDEEAPAPAWSRVRELVLVRNGSATLPLPLEALETLAVRSASPWVLRCAGAYRNLASLDLQEPLWDATRLRPIASLPRLRRLRASVYVDGAAAALRELASGPLAGTLASLDLGHHVLLDREVARELARFAALRELGSALVPYDEGFPFAEMDALPGLAVSSARFQIRAYRVVGDGAAFEERWARSIRRWAEAGTRIRDVRIWGDARMSPALAILLARCFGGGADEYAREPSIPARHAAEELSWFGPETRPSLRFHADQRAGAGDVEALEGAMRASGLHARGEVTLEDGR